MLVEDDGTLAGLWFDLHTERQKQLAIDHDMTRERFVQWANGHFLHYGIKINGAIDGVIALGLGTVHVAVRPTIKGRWLRDLEKVLRATLAIQPLIVCAEAADAAACGFIERAGGMKLRERGLVRWYLIELKRMWFMRRKL